MSPPSINRALRLNNKAVFCMMNDKKRDAFGYFQRSLSFIRNAMVEQEQPTSTAATSVLDKASSSCCSSCEEATTRDAEETLLFVPLHECDVQSKEASEDQPPQEGTGEHVCWNLIAFRIAEDQPTRPTSRADLRLFAGAIMFNIALCNHGMGISAKSAQRKHSFFLRALSIYKSINLALNQDHQPIASLVKLLSSNNMVILQRMGGDNNHRAGFEVVASLMRSTTQPLLSSLVGREAATGILLNIILSTVTTATAASAA